MSAYAVEEVTDESGKGEAEGEPVGSTPVQLDILGISLSWLTRVI
jgi:hypothetical protein